MGNMSYCRFHNTSQELVDCQRALEELRNGGEKLSREELEAAKNLSVTCMEIVAMLAEQAETDPNDLENSDLSNALDELQEESRV